MEVYKISNKFVVETHSYIFSMYDNETVMIQRKEPGNAGLSTEDYIDKMGHMSINTMKKRINKYYIEYVWYTYSLNWSTD